MTFTATSTGSAPGAGMTTMRTRISEIQRRLGVQAAWAGTSGSTKSPVSTDRLSFQQALLKAGSSSSSALSPALMDALGTTPVYATKPSSLPPVTVSDTMRAAGNGRLPDSMLYGIGQGEHRLARPAADAFVRLMNAARQDGVTIGVTDSYRDYAGQVATADRVGIYGQGGWAAVPGTSNHGWGLAVDLDLDDRAQAWMREKAWRYGFFEDVPDESWHWTYRAAS